MRRPRTAVGLIEVIGFSLAVTIILGLLAGYQLVVLTTSSMAPAAPAGSLLIVSSRSPEEVAVDDMIVMRRNSSILVTHRVVSLRPSSGGITPGDSAEILATTQGDANKTADPNPYPLEDDQRVVRLIVPKVGWIVLPIIDRTLLILVLAAAGGAVLLLMGRVSTRTSGHDGSGGPILLGSGLETDQDPDLLSLQQNDLGAERQLKS